MLDAVALESLGAAVIHVHRKGDGHGALREHQAIAIVLLDLKVIGDDLELVARHLENFVLVNAHKTRSRKVECPARNSGAICAGAGRSSNLIRDARSEMQDTP